MDKAREKGERLSMQFVYSPNTIAFAHFIFIDEATRIQREMQNRYLSILDYRVVEGVRLPVKYVWGAANPLEYEATIPMDQALADRWHLLVQPPSLHEMPLESDREAVLESVAVKLHAREVDPNGAAQFVAFLAKARGARDAIIAGRIKPFVRYVDAMIAQINKALIDSNGKPITSRAGTTTAPIDSRRAAIIVNNVIGLHAVSTAKGERGNIKTDALAAFKASMVDRLTSESGGIEDSAIEAAHIAHKDILDAAQDPIITQIEKEPNVVKRVMLAFTLNATRDDVSAYTSAALSEVKTSGQEEGATAFAYALLARLQSSPSDVSAKLNRYVFDDLYPLVIRASSIAATRTVARVEKVLVKDGSFETLHSLMQDIDAMQKTPIGRVALMIAALPVDAADPGATTTGAASPDATRRRNYLALQTRLKTVQTTLADYVRILSPIGQTPVAVNTTNDTKA